MKLTAFFIIALGLLTAFPACTSKQQHSEQAGTTLAAVGDYYTCPMHPSVRSDKPGACPICGMSLVKKSGRDTSTTNQLSSLKGVSLSPREMVLANVSTAGVARRELNRGITSVGVVSIAEPLLATIAARYNGRVERLYANYTGVAVLKGDPLFELYSPDLISATQDYILALDGLRSATVATEVQNANVQERLVTASRTRLKNHFGMTESQLAQIEKTRQIPSALRFDSPIRGTVLTLEVQEGQYVNEGMVLYKLADLSKIWIYLDVYQPDIRYLTVGQSVLATTDAYPGEEFRGRVAFIDPTINSDTRTIRVRAEFANADLRLKPNMYVEARINAPVKDALVVPTSAIIQTGKRAVVWVEAKRNTFVPRDVVVGSSDDSESEILEGLLEGDTVAVSGGFLIDSESQLAQPSDQSDVRLHPRHEPGVSPGADVKADPSTYLRNLRRSEKALDAHILVHGGYIPDVIHATVGKKLRLHFYRDEDSDCTSVVVFKEFHIRQFLPPHDTTLVEITPTKAGTIDFECGEGMIHGSVIVSK